MFGGSAAASSATAMAVPERLALHPPDSASARRRSGGRASAAGPAEHAADQEQGQGQQAQQQRWALVLDGHTVDMCLTGLRRPLFVELFRRSATAVCCRMTPKQKSEMVRVAKEDMGLVTLAIGDGANGARARRALLGRTRRAPRSHRWGGVRGSGVSGAARHACAGGCTGTPLLGGRCPHALLCWLPAPATSRLHLRPPGTRPSLTAPPPTPTRPCPRGPDVSMIRDANVGIGLSGSEGAQAAMASDYAIQRFHHLRRLLLVHGRWSNLRTASLLVLAFFNNLAFVLPQVMFALLSGFSGQTLFSGVYMSTFNLLFSSPLFLSRGLFERDLDPATLLAHPALYREQQSGDSTFSDRVFWWWVFAAMWHALVSFFSALSVFRGATAFSSDGLTAGLYVFGSFVLAVLVWGMALVSFVHQRSSSWFTAAVHVTCMLLFILLTTLISELVDSSELYGVMQMVRSSPALIFTFVLGVAVCALPHLAYLAWTRNRAPAEWQLVQERVLRTERELAHRAAAGAVGAVASKGSAEEAHLAAALEQARRVQRRAWFRALREP